MLKRSVSLFTLTLYGVGVILGAGIYAIIGKAAGEAGNSLWLSFLIAAFASMFTGLSYMELIPMFPQSAAEYVYVKKASESRLVAFVVGWVVLVAGVVSASTVAAGFANYFTELFGGPIVLVAAILIVALSMINFAGISESTKLNTIFSLIEVAGLLIVIFAALPYLGRVNLLEMPNGLTGVVSASALIFFAFIGFEDIANIAEETKDPGSTAPKALLIALASTTIIYVCIGVSSVSLAGYEQLAKSSAPLAFAVSQVFGPNAFVLMSAIALFATANTVLILLVVESRMMYGMSRDGSLPRIFSRLHRKRRTPWVAALAVMICTMLFILLEDIQLIAGIADFGTFVVYGFVNASLIILRFKEPQRKRRFKVPINIGKFPLLPFLGLLIIILLAANLQAIIILLGVMITLASVPVYFSLKKIAKLQI
jgi:APA family basic amino acid/polyamine antiporter